MDDRESLEREKHEAERVGWRIAGLSAAVLLLALAVAVVVTVVVLALSASEWTN